MTKRKLKLSLINDYVVIQSANLFFEELLSSPSFNLTEKQNLAKFKVNSNKLAAIYKQIMFKFGLINLSLALLEKQLIAPSTQKNILQNREKSLKRASELDSSLQSMAISLKQKLIKMKLNNFEINYLNI